MDQKHVFVLVCGEAEVAKALFAFIWYRILLRFVQKEKDTHHFGESPFLRHAYLLKMIVVCLLWVGLKRKRPGP